ncbi:lysozyme-like domain containing protein [Marinobacter sp. JSM 1782161]|uniref:transglycosylase SLT domain-containing protein n=1 Tax=Marinobacter sp. JSM 1782161 TaxID=2685906 RepID=UPI002B1BD2B3|nr:lysozyme-like domain containing protein [Marinobacter sp. JSM 1782161]
MAGLSWLIGGYRVLVPSPPTNPDNLCDVFEQHPQWYDYAAASEERWGTPIATQMAFVRQESAFQSHIRPPRTHLFGVIPWARPSTAFGYAQAVDPTWEEYMADAGSLFAERSQMKHALDFIGWYNARVRRQLGLSLDNTRDLYLAYHEGPTGFARQSYRQRPWVQRVANRVTAHANTYSGQLQHCETALRCRHFYSIRPFCE